METNWKEKVVLISGGTGGAGGASAVKFLTEGANVMLADINEAKLAEDAKKLSALKGKIQTVVCDVKNVAACENAIRETISKFGQLDILINAAGVWTEGESEKSTEEEWNHVVDINLKGTYFMCSRAIPELKKTQGCIINFSSDAGLMGNNEAAIYCASKGGVTLLSKALAVELAPWLVRVIPICPGDIFSPMLQFQADAFGKGDPEGYFKDLLNMYPQKEKARFIKTEEIAEIVFFLSSNKALAFTGSPISIDFGLTAGY
ncbi:MAG: SDR family oxidoreductase [Desulfobacterales bacterium]|nr:SDR family oxidoreductase [Desulfobacterales bacterium]